jgi:hypothetical protein
MNHVVQPLFTDAVEGALVHVLQVGDALQLTVVQRAASALATGCVSIMLISYCNVGDKVSMHRL